MSNIGCQKSDDTPIIITEVPAGGTSDPPSYIERELMNSHPLAVYYEKIKVPYYVLIHTRVRAGHDRFDRYASKPDGLIEFMLTVIDHLTCGQPTILDRMSELDELEKRNSSHRTRRYVAKASEDLVNPTEFKGYKFSTNADKNQAFAVIELACKSMEVPFDTVRHLPLP